MHILEGEACLPSGANATDRLGMVQPIGGEIRGACNHSSGRYCLVKKESVWTLAPALGDDLRPGAARW